MRAINAIRMGGIDVLPLVEGGKGVSISNGFSAGNWAAAGGVGTFSAVNADSFDDDGRRIPQLYHGRTRRERHEELVAYAIQGALAQARRAYDTRRRQGPHPRQHPVGDGRRRTDHHRGAGAGARASSTASPAAPACPIGCRRSPPASTSTTTRSFPRRAPSTRCGSAPIQRRRRCWAAWSTRTPGSPAAITACPTARTRSGPRTRSRACWRCAS